MNLPRIIGVTGRARHGKDTVARLLARWGYTRVAFADTLKELAMRVNPLVEGDLRLAHAVELEGWEAAKSRGEVRRILQELGVHCRDLLGEEVWVRALERRILREVTGRVVVSDVRFPNEAAWVRSVGGMLLRVYRPGFDNGVDPHHPTEAYVDTLEVDATLMNSGTIESLGLKLAALLGPSLGTELGG